MKLLSPPSSLARTSNSVLLFSSSRKLPRPSSGKVRVFHWKPKGVVLAGRMVVRACATKVEEKPPEGTSSTGKWGKVSAVLFDMDGVLCNSEEPSRMAGVDLFAEMGVQVTVEDFVPFMGTGEVLLTIGIILFRALKIELAKTRGQNIFLARKLPYLLDALSSLLGWHATDVYQVHLPKLSCC
ncbi:hypothetical protein CRG98_050007 [Punica granatum]|uniref:Uncharacterized protein n=1 Tax=Punica granatum TaxID=22663 RepID=A0A2I0H0A6_PUNGR|nr:hypothetical protein CRG98_050007 [Punica granatum]